MVYSHIVHCLDFLELANEFLYQLFIFLIKNGRYGRIYCLQVDRVAMLLHSYRFYRDAVVQQVCSFSTLIDLTTYSHILLLMMEWISLLHVFLCIFDLMKIEDCIF